MKRNLNMGTWLVPLCSHPSCPVTKRSNVIISYQVFHHGLWAHWPVPCTSYLPHLGDFDVAAVQIHRTTIYVSGCLVPPLPLPSCPLSPRQRTQFFSLTFMVVCTATWSRSAHPSGYLSGAHRSKCPCSFYSPRVFPVMSFSLTWVRCLLLFFVRLWISWGFPFP